MADDVRSHHLLAYCALTLALTLTPTLAVTLTLALTPTLTTDPIPTQRRRDRCVDCRGALGGRGEPGGGNGGRAAYVCQRDRAVVLASTAPLGMASWLGRLRLVGIV